MDGKVKNGFVKLFTRFGLSISHFIIDYIKSFKYNPSKFASYLVAVPGIIIGFALNIHSKAISVFKVMTDSSVSDWASKGLDLASEIDYSGFILFILMLAGCINLFNAVNIAKKRNLGSAISSSICAVIVVVFGIFFITYFYHTDTILNTKPMGYSQNYLSTNTSKDVFSSNSIISMSFMYISMVCSVLGSFLAFVYRDKTYKKEIID